MITDLIDASADQEGLIRDQTDLIISGASLIRDQIDVIRNHIGEMTYLVGEID